jgi:monovalent cation:H+ antiporter-2, CPA2 family
LGHVPLLQELAVIAALAVAVTVILSRVKLPTVAGLLLAGALAGPHGLGLVHSIHDIEMLAEIGVVLLLFTIGLEFSLARLKHIFRQVAVGGVLQVGVTVAAIAGIAIALGEQPSRAIFYGFVFSMSSTAIVLRALTERRELEAPHGRFIVGTLIFQDLCVVPMVLVVPLLAKPSSAGGAALDTALALGKAAGVVVLTVGLARFVVPRLLKYVDAARSRETFLLAILGLCIGTAWVTSLAGLSLALGAFLGGMVVADTEYGHRAMGDVLPLKDTFVSVFFVSLGMLFDPRAVSSQPGWVFALLAGFLLIKGFLATLAAMAMRFPTRVAWLAGVGLAQFGEFGFVLARLGESSGVVDAEATRTLLAAGIISMFLTPLLVRAAPHVRAGEKLLAPLARLIGARGIEEVDAEGHAAPRGHVVIVGFGVAGRLAARSLKACGIDFVALELNAESVRAGKAQGLAIYYGDATSPEALGHAHLETARAMVLLMNDPAAAQRVVDTAKRVAPNVPILMRSHYLGERGALLKLGANDVVAEEVEGAIEIISRLLRWADVPRNVIDDRIREARVETQDTERKATLPRKSLADFAPLQELKIESVEVRQQSAAAGSSLASLQLRSKTGALVVAVRRGNKLLEQPDAHDALQAGDIAYLVGTSDAIRAAIEVLGAPVGGLPAPDAA